MAGRDTLILHRHVLWIWRYELLFMSFWDCGFDAANNGISVPSMEPYLQEYRREKKLFDDLVVTQELL